MVRRSTIAILCVASVTAASPVGADEVRERAAAAFDEGVSRFRRGDAQGALAAFEEAYRLVPDAGILYNIGQTELALDHEAAAFRALERYLAEAGGIPRRRRNEVAATLARLRPRVGTVILTVRPPGATHAVDGRAAGPLPLGGVVYVSPGRHEIALSAAGHRDAAVTVEVAGGAEVRRDVRLEPAGSSTAGPGPTGEPARPRPPPPPGADAVDPAPPLSAGGGGVPVATLAFGAASVAAFVVATVTGVLALSRQSDVDEARRAWRRGDAVDQRAIEDEARAGETLALVTDVALGVGVAAAGVAIVFLVTGEAEEAPAARALVAPRRGGLWVGVQGALP
jgi:hypothetical protein